MKISIKQLSEMSGFSPATVSNVLNGKKGVNKDTAELIMKLARESGCPFVNNELPYGRAEPGHPVIVDYFYHEEVRGSENTGRRNTKA